MVLPVTGSCHWHCRGITKRAYCTRRFSTWDEAATHTAPLPAHRATKPYAAARQHRTGEYSIYCRNSLDALLHTALSCRACVRDHAAPHRVRVRVLAMP